jgi:hypothetical protein
MEIDISHLNTVYYREIINRFKAFRSPALDLPVDDFWARSYGREKMRILVMSARMNQRVSICTNLREI